MNISALLPKPRNNYRGPRFAVWFLLIYNIVATGRSLIHIFAADSGAQSIATMNVQVAGGQNIIALLAQYGDQQLLMAMVIWVVLWRYREFVPLMIAEVTIEQLARILVGHLKPLQTLHTAPGAIGSDILFPVALIMLILSLQIKAESIEQHVNATSEEG
ncbi:MAG: hypothetical protein K2W82_07675 [Candidatus Obscuribacterales bacterium]|nr:hypothetical protein [Candidatus Obscuribacterales bacterium]